MTVFSDPGERTFSTGALGAMMPRRVPRALLGGVLLAMLASDSVPAQQDATPAAPPPSAQSQPTASPANQPVTEAPVKARPNFFLYLIDGLRAGEVPAFGCTVMTTPTLTRMIEQGLTFTNLYAASPWTFASVASLFTSLYPASHGLERAGEMLPKSAVTLAEVLRDAGYDTALFTSHPLVGPASGLQQGFATVEEVPGPLGKSPPSAPAETSATLNNRLLSWLGQRSSTAPVFVVVVSTDLQEPFGLPEPEGSHFIDRSELAWFQGIRKKLQAIRPGPLSPLTSEDLKQLKVDARRFATAARQVYQGAIFYNDSRLRDLRNTLQSKGVLQDSFFAVTSTRGEEFLEHGRFGHGASLYDSSVRIPLMLTFPNLVSTPQQVGRMSDSVDLLPTFLALLQVPSPPGIQGVDRNLLLSRGNREQYNRPAFSDARPAGDLPTGTMSMVAEEGSKYIEYDEPPAGTERPAVELFRKGQGDWDWEEKNSAGGRPDLMAARRETLEAWKQACAGFRLQPDSPPPPPDPRLKEKLRALGYLQPTSPSKTSTPAPAARPSAESGRR